METRSSKPNSNIYRPSASVIIAAKVFHTEDNYEYKILLCKRSAPTAVASEHYVFPGGAFDQKADESIAWMRYLFQFGVEEKELHKLLKKDIQRPAPLFTSGVHFSRDISLRITAIREVFEEVGILLCRDKASLKLMTTTGSYRDDFDRQHWQKEVHNDPEKFLKLCKFLNVIPDLWSLYEWSIWRSANAAARKFDTVYYFVALKNTPDIILEHTEIEAAAWHSPIQFLKLFNKRTIWLPFMIYYEMARLTHKRKFQNIQNFAQKHNNKNLTLLIPVYVRCEDGILFLLPGDDLYPADPYSELKLEIKPLTYHKLRAISTKRHRIFFKSMHSYCIDMTIDTIDNHLSPIIDDTQKKMIPSML